MKCVTCLEQTKDDRIYCDKCIIKTENKIKNHITIDIIRKDSIHFLIMVGVLIVTFKFLEFPYFMIMFLFWALVMGLITTCFRIRVFRKKDLEIRMQDEKTIHNL